MNDYSDLLKKEIKIKVIHFTKAVSFIILFPLFI